MQPTDPNQQESHQPEYEVEEEHGVLDTPRDIGEPTGYSPPPAPVVSGLLFRVDRGPSSALLVVVASLSCRRHDQGSNSNYKLATKMQNSHLKLSTRYRICSLD